ncbi:hypothetical protein GCM10008959_25250 [Deinococcus seoulensis]|uniref:DUF2190 family protein n=1 Tax=Deinococcus seoulensis TaxID=1837379 RepID=A0ABQ2RWH5_9DEIO|nr:hypothetical protein [Deinococcus seoulensis]GGR62246.1 hypothetical protein GCM10008959_25250 [Deinococcus seoulensis]
MKFGELVFNGQNHYPTMTLANGTEIGDAVAHTGAATAGRGADGDPLLGKVLTKEADGVGTVALEGAGFTDIATVGTLPLGYQTLVVDGAGKAKVGAGGTRVLVNIATNGLANIKL